MYGDCLTFRFYTYTKGDHSEPRYCYHSGPSETKSPRLYIPDFIKSFFSVSVSLIPLFFCFFFLFLNWFLLLLLLLYIFLSTMGWSQGLTMCHKYFANAACVYIFPLYNRPVIYSPPSLTPSPPYPLFHSLSFSSLPREKKRLQSTRLFFQRNFFRPPCISFTWRGAPAGQCCFCAFLLADINKIF